MDHHLLEDKNAMEVFSRIARERLVSYRDLSDILDRENATVRDGLSGLLDQLTEEGLIEEQEAPIHDFNTYYLTVDGRAADRTRRNLEQRSLKSWLPRAKF